MSPLRLRTLILVSLAFALSFASCAAQRDSEITDPGSRTSAVVVGAFNFDESRVLAEVYKQALEIEGIDAVVVGEVASREIMEPALEQGEVDMVPEYLGTAFEFLGGTSRLTSTVDEVHFGLVEAFRERGVQVLKPAPGENRNEFVIRRETSEEHDLTAVSDLAAVDDQLILGGPPECPSRRLCLLGLQGTYGLFFESFLPLDSGGPATLAALKGHEIDVAVLFTTNPALLSPELVILEDDKGLQPPENIVPVVRLDVMERYGALIREALDPVSRLLTDDALRGLNARIAMSGQTPASVADDWLRLQGLK